MDKTQKHYYAIGVRLVRTGGYDLDRVRAYCREYTVPADLCEWIERGCTDELNKETK